MTESELFAVMVAAFSTVIDFFISILKVFLCINPICLNKKVSGSVLAAYIGFGVPPDHLITAGRHI